MMATVLVVLSPSATGDDGVGDGGGGATTTSCTVTATTDGVLVTVTLAAERKVVALWADES